MLAQIRWMLSQTMQFARVSTMEFACRIHCQQRIRMPHSLSTGIRMSYSLFGMSIVALTVNCDMSVANLQNNGRTKNDGWTRLNCAKGTPEWRQGQKRLRFHCLSQHSLRDSPIPKRPAACTCRSQKTRTRVARPAACVVTICSIITLNKETED